MLRSYGLRAAVSADDAGGQEPQLQLQGVRVLVAPDDEATARQLIADAQDTPSKAGQPAPPARRCPPQPAVISVPWSFDDPGMPGVFGAPPPGPGGSYRR